VSGTPAENVATFVVGLGVLFIVVIFPLWLFLRRPRRKAPERRGFEVRPITGETPVSRGTEDAGDDSRDAGT
jgi:hypothetical protein